MRLVIGNKAYSSWSLRGWLLIKATGLPFEEELVPLYEPGSKERMLAATPSGKVPCLIDGPVAVWDSLAILEYLNERLPQARLYPVDPAERAMHRSMVAEIQSGFSTIRTLCGMNLRRTPGPPQKPHRRTGPGHRPPGRHRRDLARPASRPAGRAQRPGSLPDPRGGPFPPLPTPHEPPFGSRLRRPAGPSPLPGMGTGGPPGTLVHSAIRGDLARA